MTSVLKKLFVLSAAFISIAASAGAGAPFNTMVFFGDSLTDNGNLYAYDLGFMPKSPPYYKGHFSNGTVWSEMTADYFAQYNISSVNYAFGGETAIFHDPVGGYLPHSLSMTLDSYLLRNLFADKSHTLFVIWIGGNDYLPGVTDVDGMTTEVVNEIKGTIDSLIGHGAVNFLVMNLPDLSKLPYSRIYNMQDVLGVATLVHNSKLEEALAQLRDQYPQVNLQELDVNSRFSDLIMHPETYNEQYHLTISETSASCWQGGYTLAQPKPAQLQTRDQILQDLLAHVAAQPKRLTNAYTQTDSLKAEGFASAVAASPDLMVTYQTQSQAGETLVPCANPDSYVFWDKLHPTHIVHQIFAATAIDFIKTNFAYEQKAK